jgi:hypothetical protein
MTYLLTDRVLNLPVHVCLQQNIKLILTGNRAVASYGETSCVAKAQGMGI